MTVEADCQAVGCAAKIKRGQFLCRPHWFGLPQKLRQQVNFTWGVRKRAMKAERRDNQAIIDHVEACDEARRFIAEGEGQLAEFVADASRIKRIYAQVEAQRDD